LIAQFDTTNPTKNTFPGSSFRVSDNGQELVQFGIDIVATQERLEQNRQALEQFNTGNDLG
jgi:hypothetical protein